VLVTLYYRDRPFDGAFKDFFDGQVGPALIETGATPLACLQTLHTENTFPALPVRTGENVFAWLARFADPARLSDHLREGGFSSRELAAAPSPSSPPSWTKSWSEMYGDGRTRCPAIRIGAVWFNAAAAGQPGQVWSSARGS
jgi:hypothetical protein